MGDNQGRGTAVLQDKSIFLGGQAGINGHGDNPRLDGAQKADRKIKCIVETQNNPLLCLETNLRQGIRRSVDLIAEFLIAVRACAVYIGRFPAAACG